MVKRLNRTKNIISKQMVGGRQASVIFNESLIQNNDVLQWVGNTDLKTFSSIGFKK